MIKVIKKPKRKSLTAVLKGVKPTFKSKVYKVYDRMLENNKISGRNLNNNEKRFILTEAIFEVENELEHNRSEHSTEAGNYVKCLRDARNYLYDYMYYSETI
jgi:hypothetical protein